VKRTDEACDAAGLPNMSKSTSPAQEGQTQESLADEIRTSEKLFVDAAVEQFRRMVAMEYYRLRGYAIEAGGTEIHLKADVHFNFDPARRSVQITSVPDFLPAPLTRTAQC